LHLWLAVAPAVFASELEDALKRALQAGESA
jgi:hypothetical protein